MIDTNGTPLRNERESPGGSESCVGGRGLRSHSDGGAGGFSDVDPNHDELPVPAWDGYPRGASDALSPRRGAPIVSGPRTRVAPGSSVAIRGHRDEYRRDVVPESGTDHQGTPYRRQDGLRFLGCGVMADRSDAPRYGQDHDAGGGDPGPPSLTNQTPPRRSEGPVPWFDGGVGGHLCGALSVVLGLQCARTEDPRADGSVADALSECHDRLLLQRGLRWLFELLAGDQNHEAIVWGRYQLSRGTERDCSQRRISGSDDPRSENSDLGEWPPRDDVHDHLQGAPKEMGGDRVNVYTLSFISPNQRDHDCAPSRTSRRMARLRVSSPPGNIPFPITTAWVKV